jgi:FkbM family methyltransferase
MKKYMADLYFLGIKKSSFKKIPPFKYYFEFRDYGNYKGILQSVSKQYSIHECSQTERKVTLPVNGSEAQLVFRKFPASDLSVLNQIFIFKCYYPIIEKMLRHFNNQDNVRIMDVGANVGYASVYFKSFFPQAEIIGVEPDNSNLEQIEKNSSLNKFTFRKLVKGGLWYRHAYLEVVRDFRDNRDASVTVQETSVPGELIGYSFDELLVMADWDEVDLLKIDIEGSERFLFDEDQKADSILSKTSFLALEIHDEFNIRSQIYAHLERNNFEYFEFDDLTLAINKSKLTH